MKHLRLFTLFTLLLAAFRLSAQERYIYADSLTIDAGGEGEIVVRMDFDTDKEITWWSFTIQLPEGIGLKTPESPLESCFISSEMYDLVRGGDGSYPYSNLQVSNNPDGTISFGFFTNEKDEVTFTEDGGFYQGREPIKSTHCEILRIAVTSTVTQTVKPVITNVWIKSNAEMLVKNDEVVPSVIPNVLYVDNTEALVGTDFTLSVKMRNDVDAEGFAFDLILPAGMSVATDDEGELMVSLSEERTTAERTNTFSVVKISNLLYDAVRVIAASTNGSAIPAGDGEVCTVRVHVGTGLKKGKYQATLTNISIADTEARSLDKNEMPFSITLLALEVGDANGDGNITVADLTAIAHHILGNTPEGFSTKAADANQDGVIDVADYTAVAHLLLFGSITRPAASRAMNNKRETANSKHENIATDLTGIDNTVYIEPVIASAGEELTLSVKMKNSVEVEGFQFGLCLPEGASVVCDADGQPEACLSTERTTARRTNTFQAAIQADGSLRVMAASTSASAFNGNDGEVCTVKVKLAADMAMGDYALLLRDVAISDASAKSYNSGLVETTLTVGEPSAIEENLMMKPSVNGCIFDLQGRRVTGQPRRGVYIQDGRKRVR